MFPALTIKQQAQDLGFDLVGIAPAAAREDLAFLREWVQEGYSGDMHYMEDPRREDLQRVLPSVRSVICVGLIFNTPFPYSTEVTRRAKGEQPSPADSAEGEAAPRAWISRYGWGTDYHDLLRDKLEKLRTAVEKLSSGVETRVYVDTGPVVERAFARLSGIGWMGKNTCLINQQKGSWFFLGVILTNLDLELDLPAPDRCGSCTRCLEACPTGALIKPYVMDGSRCIAYFNIELKGNIPEEFRDAIGNNIIGCDICQDVCPWNNRRVPASHDPGAADHEDAAMGYHPKHATTTVAEFQPLQIEVQSTEPPAENGSAAQSSRSVAFSLFNPSLEALASLSEEDFRRLLARSPIKRTKYRGWLRNLCVAMGNSGDGRFLPWLGGMATNADPIVREHAAWALEKLRAKE